MYVFYKFLKCIHVVAMGRRDDVTYIYDVTRLVPKYLCHFLGLFIVFPFYFIPYAVCTCWAHVYIHMQCRVGDAYFKMKSVRTMLYHPLRVGKHGKMRYLRWPFQ